MHHATDTHETYRPAQSTEVGDRGASLVEYALLVALLAIACLGAIRYIGTSTSDGIENSTNSMVEAGLGGG